MLLRRDCFVRGLTLCVLLSLYGCGHSTPSVAASEKETRPDTVPHQRDANDIGRFVAGMPGTAGSPFAALEATDAWVEHRRWLDEAWSKADGSLISGLQEFQKE